jgi:hypothetical protein
MKQEQKQEQTQIQLVKMMSLNGWLEALLELDRYENLPYNYEFAKYAKGKMLDDVNFCITQTLAPVKQIKEDIRDNSISFRKRFVTIVLEFQSLRTKHDFDIIDELCLIVISNAIGISKDVPFRITKNEIELTEEQLNEFISNIGKSQYEVENKIKQLVGGGEIVKFVMLDSKEKDYKKGLERYRNLHSNIYNDINKYLAQ